MGKPINRTVSFFTFDLPLNAAFNRLVLHQTHRQNSLSSNYWSIQGTKQVLLSAYWYKYVIRHFSLVVVAVSLGYSIMVSNRITAVGFGVLFMLLALLYIVLYISVYQPFYSRIYLPQINSLIDTRTKAEKERKAAEEAKKVSPPQPEPTKSARTQTKIPALTIIHFVLFQTAGIKTLACDDKSAKLINTLTGGDTGSIKENLRRIFKPSSLSVKERAEMRKGIESAEIYFTELDHKAALVILDQLRQKFERD